MAKKKLAIEYEIFAAKKDLSPLDQELFYQARLAFDKAYAPYSNFKVAAAGRLSDGTIVVGTNQENASYPVGICAERSLLTIIANVHPKAKLLTIALTYQYKDAPNHTPIFPCGMCRQALIEFEQKQGVPIRCLIGGLDGTIVSVESLSQLLPFSFSSKDLGL